MPALIALTIALLAMWSPRCDASGDEVGDLVQTEASDQIVAVYRDGVVYASELGDSHLRGTSGTPPSKCWSPSSFSSGNSCGWPAHPASQSLPKSSLGLRVPNARRPRRRTRRSVGSADRASDEEIRRRYEKNIDIYVHPPMI